MLFCLQVASVFCEAGGRQYIACYPGFRRNENKNISFSMLPLIGCNDCNI